MTFRRFVLLLGVVSATLAGEFVSPSSADVLTCYDKVKLEFDSGTSLGAGKVVILDNDLGAALWRGLTKWQSVLGEWTAADVDADGFVTIPDMGDRDENSYVQLRLYSSQDDYEPDDFLAKRSLRYVCTNALRQNKDTAGAFRLEQCRRAQDNQQQLEDGTVTQASLGPLCEAEASLDGCRCLSRQLFLLQKAVRVGLLYGCNAASLVLAETALHKRILEQRCVAAPCELGGFCSTEAVCTGDGYTWSAESKHCLGGGGCCAPPCRVLLEDDRVQPGQCEAASSADSIGKAVVRADHRICWPLSSSSAGSSSCVHTDTHCCTATPCATDGVHLDGLCLPTGTCSAAGATSTPHKQSVCRTSQEVCCAVGIKAANSRTLDNPKTNQDSADVQAAFKDGKEQLSIDATALRWSLLTAGVALAMKL